MPPAQNVLLESPAASDGGAAGMPSAPVSGRPPIDVRRLRHPAEGTWACYYDATGTSQMIWTSSNLDILASANARAQTPQRLHDWFFSPAETGPR